MKTPSSYGEHSAGRWTTATASEAARPDPAKLDESWTDPRPLTDGPAAMAFPIDTAFPEDLKVVRDFVEGVAEQLQVPVDLPAMVLLSMTAACIAQKFEIQPRLGWREVAALWVLVLLFSGERKSGTFSIMIDPILAWENAQAELMAPQIARRAEERTILELRLAAQRKKAARANAENRAFEISLAVELAEELQRLPVLKAPTIYVSDATTEALAGALVENQERALVASPEGDALDVMLGRYTERNTPNLGIWLKAHAGDAERIIRKSRAAEYLKRPVAPLAMVVQPEAVRGMFASRTARGRGLLGRFLPSAPASTLGRRKTGGAAKPIPAHLNLMYQRVLWHLLDLSIDENKGAEIVGLDADATTLFFAFEANVEKQLGRDGSLGERRDWGAKLCGAVARIALVLFGLRFALAGGCARSAGCAHEVDGSIMRAALSWVPYLIEHEKIVAGVVGADKEMAVAQTILSWVRRTNAEAFTRRDAFTANRSVLVQVVEDIDGALDLLEELGYIRRGSAPAGSRHGGRKASPEYAVNPRWNREVQS